MIDLSDLHADRLETGLPSKFNAGITRIQDTLNALDLLIAGGANFQGEHDASTGSYPAGPAARDTWLITVPGVMGGEYHNAGAIIFYGGTGWFKTNVGASLTDALVAGAVQTQGGATAMLGNVNRFATVANEGDGGLLPPPILLQQVIVINDGDEAMKVWPPGGVSVDGGAPNVADPVLLSPGQARIYIAPSTTAFRSLSVKLRLDESGNIIVGDVFANGVKITGATPAAEWYEEDAGSDEKLWQARVNGDSWQIRTRTDADGAGKDALTITRVGTALTTISYGNSTDKPAHSLNGRAEVLSDDFATFRIIGNNFPGLRMQDTDLNGFSDIYISAGSGLNFSADPGNVDSSTNIRWYIDGNQELRLNPGQGISFDNANYLGDYEEGSWTPVLTDLTNNLTLDVAIGWYTRIGNMIFVGCTVRSSSLGSASGPIYITGLPFTAINTATHWGAVHTGVKVQLNITAGQSVAGQIANNTSRITLYLSDAAAGDTPMTAAEWSADGYANFRGSYEV